MKRYAALCVFCVLSLLVFFRIIWSAESEAPKQAPEQAPATYVGNEVCQACHAPAFEKFSQTMMGKFFSSTREMKLKAEPVNHAMDREATTLLPGAARV